MKETRLCSPEVSRKLFDRILVHNEFLHLGVVTANLTPAQEKSQQVCRLVCLSNLHQHLPDPFSSFTHTGRKRPAAISWPTYPALARPADASFDLIGSGLQS